jgi:peptidoglycan hydrolase-like protein with peptidoglycan-binding domain
VTEIQQALIREGYLKGPATGTWDDSTKSAMKSYQSNNGFATTGLPDAKSIMKLGLGPHPLPVDVKQSGAAQASVQTSARPNP